MVSGPEQPIAAIEEDVRSFFVDTLPIEHAPAHLRLAFHDAGTYDVTTRTGGAHGGVRLIEELSRPENADWSTPCIDLIQQAKERFPAVSWADLVAVGGAAAVQTCGGPVIRVGLGRSDAAEPAPEKCLLAGSEGAAKLRQHFEAMGLSLQDLVVLSGAHTLGGDPEHPFTRDPLVFSTSYYRALLAGDDGPDSGLLPSDRALIADPELRPFVEQYAHDEEAFFQDFQEAYRRLSWLGNDDAAARSTTTEPPASG